MKRLGIILACLLMFSSTGGLPRTAEGAQSAVAVYTFGVVPQYPPRKLYAIWHPIITELERRTGLSFRLITTLTIQDFERQYLAGSFDFVYMNPYFIVTAAERQGYIPLVADARPLRGILVTAAHGPIRRVEDLAGKVVAFPSPNALGASLLIRADLDRLFHTAVKPLYVKTHSSVYLHVVQGLAAAGGGVEKTFEEQDRTVRDALRILYRTRAMPSHPVAAHPRVAAAIRDRVQQAFLAMGKTRRGRKLLAPVPIAEIKRVSLADYLPMRSWGLESYRVQTGRQKPERGGAP